MIRISQRAYNKALRRAYADGLKAGLATGRGDVPVPAEGDPNPPLYSTPGSTPVHSEATDGHPGPRCNCYDCRFYLR